MLRTYWMKELRVLFRDRNILLYGLLLPIFLYPTLLFGITQIRLYTEGLHERIMTDFADLFPELHQVEHFVVIPDFLLALMEGMAMATIASSRDREERIQAILTTLKVFGKLLPQFRHIDPASLL